MTKFGNLKKNKSGEHVASVVSRETVNDFTPESNG